MRSARPRSESAKPVDAENKQADTAMKRRLTDYEPWRLILAAFLSGAATVGAVVGLLTFILRG